MYGADDGMANAGGSGGGGDDGSGDGDGNEAMTAFRE